jgi:hypothetical protein
MTPATQPVGRCRARRRRPAVPALPGVPSLARRGHRRRRAGVDGLGRLGRVAPVRDDRLHPGAADGAGFDLLDLADAVRNGLMAITTFGVGLLLPQFFTSAAGRVTHGVLLAAGCVLPAAVLWRAAGGQTARR